MRGYRGDESDDELGDEEIDGDAVESFFNALPATATCYSCCGTVTVKDEKPIFFVKGMAMPYVDCPNCGYNVGLYRLRSTAMEIADVFDHRSFESHEFIWPIRNWWRRLTNYYKRRGSVEYAPL